MASELEESFEGAGYENSWAETVDTGNTVDEDDGAVTPPTNGGSETLNIVGGGANLNAYAEFDRGSGLDGDNYIRFYFRPTLIDTGDTNTVVIFSLFDGVVNVLRVLFRYTSTNGRHVTLGYYDNGNKTMFQEINLDATKWYRIEMRYQSDGALNWEGRIFEDDSTTALQTASGTIGSPRTGPRYVRVGHSAETARADDINFDGVAWDNADWIGPLAAAGGGVSIDMWDRGQGIPTRERIEVVSY